MIEPSFNLGDGNWAGKSGNLLGYHKISGNFYADDLTFTRASTGTIVNAEGLIESVASGMPRVDYLNNSNGSLLLEPQITNLVTYSEDLSNAAWSKLTNTTVNSNQAISPSGTLNADEFSAIATSTSLLAIQDGFSVSSGANYTISFFAKKGSIKYIQLFNGSSQVTNNPRTNFDLENGTVYVSDANHNSSIEDYGNGWYRCSVSVLTASTTLQMYFNAVKDGNASRSSTSNFIIGDNLYVYGAMLEAGSYATSLINTSGTAVTRNLDTFYNDNLANTIGQTEGTFYLETVPLNSLTSYTERVVQFESSGSDFMTIQRSANSTITFYGTDGVNSWSIVQTGLFVGGETIKIAGAYKDNDIALYVNGVQIGTDTSANAPQTQKLRFANNPSGSLGYIGSHQEFQLYKTRLTNAELATLTTL